MPVKFPSKKDYIKKLTEFVIKDAKSVKIEKERIAERCNFRFFDHHQIYSMLELKIDKDLLQYIKQNTLMSVVIREKNGGGEYVGTGVVKKIKFNRTDP